MLKLENINTYYGNIHALHDVSLEVKAGEIVTLIGANGAGNTTTLLTICGAIKAKSGTVKYNDKVISSLKSNEIVKLGVSQVPEGRLIFPDMTVQENLDLGAFLRNDKEDIKRDLDYIYTLFPILAKRNKQQGGSLLGGEQQRLAISSD